MLTIIPVSGVTEVIVLTVHVTKTAETNLAVILVWDNHAVLICHIENEDVRTEYKIYNQHQRELMNDKIEMVINEANESTVVLYT